MTNPGNTPAAPDPSSLPIAARRRGGLARVWLALLVLIVCWDAASRLDDSGTPGAPSADAIETAGFVAALQDPSMLGAAR